MPIYLQVLLVLACIAAILDIAWVIAFHLGKFRGSLEQALYKEIFLRRSLLRAPGALIGLLGISILYLGASSPRATTTIWLLLERIGFFIGVIFVLLSILMMLWYLSQRPVPIWLVPAWARPEIRNGRASKSAPERRTP